MSLLPIRDDASGNQTTLSIGGITYTQEFDYENRLVEIREGATTLAAFVYDADGNRIVSTVDGATTVTIGDVFEYQNGATTRYFPGPAGPLAVRRTGYGSDDGIFYLLGDHLGSTGVLLRQDSTAASQHNYYPFGGNRGGAFSAITTRCFTGQYHEAALPGGEGSSYYNARWYDPQLGCFISADTLVPDPTRQLEPCWVTNRSIYLGRRTLPKTRCHRREICRGTGCRREVAPRLLLLPVARRLIPV